MKERNDYVNVRLTEAGDAASGGALTFSNRHMHYGFTRGETTEVLRAYEWSHVLSKITAGGAAMLEIAGEGDEDARI